MLSIFLSAVRTATKATNLRRFPFSPLLVTSIESRRSIHICDQQQHAAVKSLRATSKVRLPLKDRMKEYLRWNFSAKYAVKHSGVYLYENCVDRIDLREWNKRFQLPDTFLTWFLVTELHVWMCMIRSMAESDQRKGFFLRNEIVSSLWSDTDTRMKKLATISSSLRRNTMNDLSDHFNAMLFIYDEGSFGNDISLANSLWRVLLSNSVNAVTGPQPQPASNLSEEQQHISEKESPHSAAESSNTEDSQVGSSSTKSLAHLRLEATHLEEVVRYVRCNLAFLDSMSYEQFSAENSWKWKPLQNNNK